MRLPLPKCAQRLGDQLHQTTPTAPFEAVPTAARMAPQADRDKLFGGSCIAFREKACCWAAHVLRPGSDPDVRQTEYDTCERDDRQNPVKLSIGGDKPHDRGDEYEVLDWVQALKRGRIKE